MSKALDPKVQSDLARLGMIIATAPDNVRAVVSADYAIDSVFVDEIVPCSTASTPGSITIKMPVPTLGRSIPIVDYGGAAAGRNILIAPNAGELFLGTSNGGVSQLAINTNWGHYTLKCLDGTNWYVIDSSFGNSVGPVISRTSNTVGTGVQALVNVPQPALNTQFDVEIRVSGRVTANGASAVVGDAAQWYGTATFKNVGGVVTQLGTTTQLTTRADTSHASDTFGYLGVSGTNLQFGATVAGVPNTGATIQWTVTVQITNQN